ncbi:hypothetical protein ACQJBY_010652 [Aegilops geniculata]
MDLLLLGYILKQFLWYFGRTYFDRASPSLVFRKDSIFASEGSLTLWVGLLFPATFSGQAFLPPRRLAHTTPSTGSASAFTRHSGKARLLVSLGFVGPARGCGGGPVLLLPHREYGWKAHHCSRATISKQSVQNFYGLQFTQPSTGWYLCPL